MSQKQKESKKSPPPAASGQAEGPDNDSPDSARKGGGLKLAVIVILAMLASGGGVFAAMRFLGGASSPRPEEGSSPAAVASGGSEAGQAGEEGEPIVAPSKSRSEGGGHGEAATAGAPGEEALVPEGPVIVDLKTFTTNLNEPSGRRFLKVTLSMEVDDQEAADELKRKMSDVMDVILMLLSSQSADDISSPDGKERLRSQILNRTNNIMTKSKVRKVKYSEFIIQ
jgi:flagellar FliL protein